MTKERLSTVDSNFCDQILKYGNIKEGYSFRLGSENKRQYVIDYEGYTYYLTKTDGYWTYIHIKRIEKMKKYSVYIEIPDDCYCVKCDDRYTKIGAMLLSKKIKHVWKDVNTVIYDREKGNVIYEK